MLLRWARVWARGAPPLPPRAERCQRWATSRLTPLTQAPNCMRGGAGGALRVQRKERVCTYVAGFTAIVGKLGEHLTVAAFRLAPPPHWHYCSPGRCACRVEVPE